MAPPPTHIDVLGIAVSATDLPGAADTIDEWIRSGEANYVCVTGVHGVSESQYDPSLARIHNEAGMVVPDGMPLVWCGHRAGAPDMARVYGPDLMLEMCRRAADAGHRFYFYGGAEGTPELLRDRLVEQFPTLNVVGVHSPPFRPLTPEEDDAVVEEIAAARPDIVWVGLSTPKQERWMAAHHDRIDAVLIGVGAAFDFHAGNLAQAPAWMQSRGLEWLYRLIREPRRLWRRYLTNNPRFVARILRRPPRALHRASTTDNPPRSEKEDIT
jgi:N-acetylglucosaminyldiphosphoundecaprenol N-acetyl-beta-D-mannosaminyltransferase